MKKFRRISSLLGCPLSAILAATPIWVPMSNQASAQTTAQQTAQQPAQPTEVPTVTTPVVPQQVRYAGKMAARTGDTGEADFRIYAAPEGGDPLWTEHQLVTVAEDGSYSVLLGAASPAGLPQAVFSGGAARWLGVSVDQSPEQERVLLSSVPYAMKSADAESLAGHPASDFVTHSQFAQFAQLAQSAQSQSPASSATPTATPQTSGTVTGSGTAGTIPLWTASLTQGNSNIYQVGSDIGIGESTPTAALDVNGSENVRGSLYLPPVAVGTSTVGQHSQILELGASAWSSSTNAAVTPTFKLLTNSVNNNTPNASGQLEFHFQQGTASVNVLSIANNGVISFAPKQTFPGTIASVSAASPLTSTTTSGAVALGLNLSALETTLNSQYAQLGAVNKFTQPITFAATQTFPGTGTITGVTAGAGLTGGGTTGAISLALDPKVIPTLTGSPVFNGSSGDGLSGDTAGNTVGTAGVVGLAGSGNTSGYSGIAGVWGNASAHVGILGTSDQYPGVQGISNSGYGVQGNSTSNVGVSGTSSSGAGVAGSSTTGAGVVGYTAGSTVGTAGTFGIAGSRTSFNGIAGIWGDAAAHVGVFGSSNQYAGVAGSSVSGPGVQGTSTSGSAGSFTSTGSTATISSVNSGTTNGSAVYAATSGPNASTIYADSTGSGGNAIAGIATGGAGSSGAQPVGVYGYSGGGNGIHGVSANTSGIFAETSSTSAQDAALYAYSHNKASGVYAYSAQMGIHAVSGGASVAGTQSYAFPNGPAAVWGDTNGNGYAIVGTTDNGVAGQFINSSASQQTMYVGNQYNGSSSVAEFAGSNGACSVFGNGDLLCTGTVSSAIATKDAARTVTTYSVQSAENWYEDAGSAHLVNGVAHVQLDPTFGETVNTAIEYHVFLTPGGDSEGLYVTNKTAQGFEVREQHGGHSNIDFDYRIMAKRVGHENERLVDVTGQMKKQAENQVRARRPAPQSE